VDKSRLDNTLGLSPVLTIKLDNSKKNLSRRQHMRRLTEILFLMTFSLTGLLTSTFAQTNIGGYWEGVIADAGRELRFNVEFRVGFNGEPNQLKGRIDVPDLYIFD